MTQNRILTMTKQEVTRCEVLKMAEEKKITQKQGAHKIKVSERHFRRLMRKYRRDGPEGLVSEHRGKPSNNQMLPEKRAAIIEKLQTEYVDFGPTLASEKLKEREGLKVSKETVRQIMIQEGLHKPKKHKI